jgi:hypothetical protein
MKNILFTVMLMCFLLGQISLKSVSAAVDFETEQSKINTEDAYPVAPGEFEFEFAYGFLSSSRQFGDTARRASRGRLREHTYDMGVAMGLHRRAELNFAIGYADLFDKDNDGPSHGHGWSDLEIGSKILLYHSDEHELTLSYSPSVRIPSGRESTSDRFGPGKSSTQISQRLIVSKNWGRWNANFDSGYGLLVGDRQGERGSWDSNLAVGYQLFSWLQPACELNYAHDFKRSSNDADTFAMTYGLIMPVHERFRIDAGVQQVLAGRNADNTTTASVAVTLFL